MGRDCHADTVVGRDHFVKRLHVRVEHLVFQASWDAHAQVRRLRESLLRRWDRIYATVSQ